MAVEEPKEASSRSQIPADDRMWAALAWLPITPLWPILAAVALLMEETKDREFIRYNALLSIATGIILIPLSIVTLGCAALVYLVFFYWAYLAFQGQEVKVPVVSDWVMRQNWV
jgi:hypothetical protein